jgi:hypothetical protein
MVWINAKGFQGYFQCILKTFSLASMGALSLLQLTVQESFGDAVVCHPCEVACPSELMLHKHSLDTGKLSSCKNFSVWNLFLPFDGH